MQKELIRIEKANIGGEIVQSINARVLHQNLALKKKFTHWISKQLNMFNEGRDYVIFSDLKVTKKLHGNIKEEYFLTLDTAKHIAMLSRTKRGKELRQYFIDVEKRHNHLLKQQADKNWKLSRSEGKRIRLSQTDAIQSFIGYAEISGSSNAEKYYMIFSKMENDVLFIINKSKSDNVRDLLNTEQLFQIGTADQLIAQTIREGIKQEMYYKDIYKATKHKVKTLADLIGVSEVPSCGSLLGHNSQYAIDKELEEVEEEAATSPSDK